MSWSNWNQNAWSSQPPATANTNVPPVGYNSTVPAVGYNASVPAVGYNSTAPPPPVQPIGATAQTQPSQCTPEQWTAMQQNWQQWMQWQQQYSQWQQQYGEQYQKAIAMGAVPAIPAVVPAAPAPIPVVPVAVPTPVALPVQPPLPQQSQITAPLPPLPQAKPPPPPEDSNKTSQQNQVLSFGGNVLDVTQPPPFANNQPLSFKPAEAVQFNQSKPPAPESKGYQQDTTYYDSQKGQYDSNGRQDYSPNKQRQNNFNRFQNQSQFGNGSNPDYYNSSNQNENKFGQAGQVNQGSRFYNQGNEQRDKFAPKGQQQSKIEFPQQAQTNTFQQSEGFTKDAPPSLWNTQFDKPPDNTGNKRKPDSKWSSSNIPEKSYRWSETTESKSDKVKPAVKPNPADISEAEKTFDEQFKAWEEQFMKWKEQNANHPDKQQYKQYEAKWESWRNQLLDRREQMRRKRLGITGQVKSSDSTQSAEDLMQKTEMPALQQDAKTVMPALKQDVKTAIPALKQEVKTVMPALQQEVKTVMPVLQKDVKTVEEKPKLPVVSADSKGILQTGNPMEIYKEPPKEQRQRSRRTSKTESNTSDAEIKSKADCESTEIKSDYTFISSKSAEGIPGLDLVGDEQKAGTEKEKPPAAVKEPGVDYDAISKGINNILGDEKLMNMLSIVTQNKNIPPPNHSVPPPPNHSMPPPSNRNAPPPTNHSVPPPSIQEHLRIQNKLPSLLDLPKMAPPFKSGETWNSPRNFDKPVEQNRDDYNPKPFDEKEQNWQNKPLLNDPFGRQSFGYNQEPNRIDSPFSGGRRQGFEADIGKDTPPGFNSNNERFNFGHGNRSGNNFGPNSDSNRFNSSDNRDFNTRRFSPNRGMGPNESDRPPFNQNTFEKPPPPFDQTRMVKPFLEGRANLTDMPNFNPNRSFDLFDQKSNFGPQNDRNQTRKSFDNVNFGPNRAGNEFSNDPPRNDFPGQRFGPNNQGFGPRKPLLGAPFVSPADLNVSKPLFGTEIISPFKSEERLSDFGKNNQNLQQNDFCRRNEIFGQNNGRRVFNAPNFQSKDYGHKPTFDSDAILAPAKVVDYGHKPVHLQDADAAFVEPVKTFDYGHSSKDVPKDLKQWQRHEGGSGGYNKYPSDSKYPSDNKYQNDNKYHRNSQNEYRNNNRKDFNKSDDNQYYNQRNSYKGASKWGDDSRDKYRQDYGGGNTEDNTHNWRSNYDQKDDKIETNTNKISKNVMLTKNVVMIDDLLCNPGRKTRPARIVIILRGPPGSGKTFLAKLIKDKEVENGGSAPRILSLDDYFMVETEVATTDPETGRKIQKKEMVYEYEECMEPAYLSSLDKAFRKTINDGYFSFIIVDCINDKISQYEEMWSFAKQNGFQVYVCQLEMDAASCWKRNIHGRTEAQVQSIVKAWEETPLHHLQLDATCLVQAASIPEVEMDDVSSDSPIPSPCDEAPAKGDEDPDEESTYKSKWEVMEHTFDKLARLDGTNKPLRHQSMKDYLQLDEDEWKEPERRLGEKRVRWADLVEKNKQDKMRAIGFVVGQTDWNRMMDPSQGSSALTQTKFIESFRKF